jgi:TetR/AcrR family transcriptional regulator, mexCD-oprJ operon repressor
MSEPVIQLRPRYALQQRVAGAIVEAAARVLADRGEQASMTQVAQAAGVARATVYRYFPTREALLGEVARRAVDDAGARLAAARIDRVPAEEGVSRAVRALADVGEAFVVLAREHIRPDREQFERVVDAPLRALFERGQAEHTIRADVPASLLVEGLLGLAAGALAATPALGREDAIAATTRLLLDGARER